MIPILIIAYNRPVSLERLIDSIVKQEHGEIFVHCDGPKSETDQGSVLTRKLVRQLHDEGIVSRYFFQDSNLGLMDAVHFASDWFFETNEFGLILEDDLILYAPALMEAEYLRDELLAHPKVEVFCLANPLPRVQMQEIEGSFWFSNFFVSYAWATSRENWNASRRSISPLDELKLTDFVRRRFGFVIAFNFRRLIRSEVEKERVNRKKCSFAWRFTFDQILNGNLVIISKLNRVGYSGFGEDSTNTNEMEIWGSDFGKFVDRSPQSWVRPLHTEPQSCHDRYFLRDQSLIRSVLVALRVRTRIRRFIKRNYMLRD
jgi:hypothetical protein